MKRTEYHIKSSLGHKATKFAWNTAKGEIQNMVRALATETRVKYVLIDSVSTKDDDGRFASGSRTWENQLNGSRVVFTITKEN